MDSTITLQSSLQMLQAKASGWIQIFIANIPNLIAATVVFGLFVIVARLIRSGSRPVIRRATDNLAIHNLFENIIYISILTVGFFTALEILKLDKTVTSILAGLGVMGFALGFAFQDIASNFVSGVIIAFKKPYQIGDFVEIESFFGEVTDIQLRATIITTFEGVEVLVPNKEMFTKAIKNYTRVPKMRLDVNVGVGYSSDLDLVEKVTLDVMNSLEGKLPEVPAEVFFTAFGGSSIDLVARVWIHYPANGNFFRTRHEAIKRIKKAYDQNNINIPFPIRTLELDPGMALKAASAVKNIFSSPR